MKRSIIRFLGVCFGGMMAFLGHVYAATQTINGVISEFEGTSTSRNGYAVFFGNAGNESFVSTYGCGSNQTFNDRAGCNGYSYCNGTGVYCTNSAYFTAKGCSWLSDSQSIPTGTGCYYKNTYWSEYTSGSYTFRGCDAGYYVTTASACAPGRTGIGSYSEISNCCGPCPMYYYNAAGGSTVTNTGQVTSNCASGWCWDSTTGSGITSCRAYPNPSGQTFTDNSGTFVYPDGCPYK